MDYRVKPLVVLVKKWAKNHGINDASMGTLSSYALTLMVIHYLQGNIINWKQSAINAYPYTVCIRSVMSRDKGSQTWHALSRDNWIAIIESFRFAVAEQEQVTFLTCKLQQCWFFYQSSLYTAEDAFKLCSQTYLSPLFTESLIKLERRTFLGLTWM